MNITWNMKQASPIQVPVDIIQSEANKQCKKSIKN